MMNNSNNQNLSKTEKKQGGATKPKVEAKAMEEAQKEGAEQREEGGYQ